jgi:acyl transferase domain-containing protein
MGEEERSFLVNNLAYRRMVLQAYENYDVEHFLGTRIQHTRDEALQAMEAANTSRGLGRTDEQVKKTTIFALNRNARLCFLDLCSNEYGAGAAYWWQNTRATVLFEPALRRMLDDGYTHFVELGPHPVLAASIFETAGTEKALVLPTQRRNDDDGRSGMPLRPDWE